MSATRGLIAFLWLAAAGASGCRPAAGPPSDTEPTDPPWFRDVGLDFVHDAGPLPAERYFLPQIIGSGAALFDYDGDGRLDIYLVQNGGPRSDVRNRLFHQEKDGSFTDVSARSGLDVAGHGMGVAVGDVNNDGHPDVLLTEYSGIRLFVNRGDGTFAYVTRSAGLVHPHWATSACFVDYDRDGWLDLVVVNYVDYDPTRVCDAGGKADYCPPWSFQGTVTRLYHNRGKSGNGGVAFEDVTVAAGLGRTPGPGLGVLAADFDGDGWPDILVANDAQPNRLWINRHDGTFRDEAAQRGLAYNGLGQPQGNMGIALGDVDGSDRFAVFITHLNEELHTLWTQESPGRFRDGTAAAGLAASRWHGTGFGTFFGDFDNDGALDLAIVNGSVSRVKLSLSGQGGGQLPPSWRAYAERNQLFAGDGAGHFRDLSPRQPDFCGTANVGRGLALGDLDNDGGLDLLVTRVAGPAGLYRNVVPNRGHWLIVRAVDPALKRDAYGAEIIVRADGRRWRGWVNPGSSYLCSNDPRVHFGLGGAARVESIEVRWPDGTVEHFPERPADQVVLVRKGEGKRR